jgi:hypothetical protein
MEVTGNRLGGYTDCGSLVVSLISWPMAWFVSIVLVGIGTVVSKHNLALLRDMSGDSCDQLQIVHLSRPQRQSCSLRFSSTAPSHTPVLVLWHTRRGW